MIRAIVAGRLKSSALRVPTQSVCVSGPRQVKVRLDYSFSDGKPRRPGYSTVAENDGLSGSAGLTQL